MVWMENLGPIVASPHFYISWFVKYCTIHHMTMSTIKILVLTASIVSSHDSCWDIDPLYIYLWLRCPSWHGSIMYHLQGHDPNLYISYGYIVYSFVAMITTSSICNESIVYTIWKPFSIVLLAWIYLYKRNQCMTHFSLFQILCWN